MWRSDGEGWPRASAQTHLRQRETATHSVLGSPFQCLFHNCWTARNNKDGRAYVCSPLLYGQLPLLLIDHNEAIRRYPRPSSILRKETHLEFYAKVRNCALSIQLPNDGTSLDWKLTITTSQEPKVRMFWLSSRSYMLQIHDVRGDFTNILVTVIWLINSNTV